MKKLLILLFALFITLVGCNNSEQSEAPSDTQIDSESVENEKSTEDKGSFILATTTSTQDSGLLEELIPIFEENTGYMVKTIAVGTGKALEMGNTGEADALLVHAPAAEMKLVENESAINYQLVMHNDFVIVGPKDDPAGIKGGKSAADALKKISESESLFISRGDDSGTHKKEKAFWADLEMEPSGKWYQESGQGMGATLRIASDKLGYTLTDRATYLALKDELDLAILVQGDEKLLNIYHVMQVNPEKFDTVKGEPGKAFVEFMVSKEAQEVIKNFGVDKYREPLFFPDAIKE